LDRWLRHPVTVNICGSSYRRREMRKSGGLVRFFVAAQNDIWGLSSNLNGAAAL
jgi:hypothetical protein